MYIYKIGVGSIVFIFMWYVQLYCDCRVRGLLQTFFWYWQLYNPWYNSFSLELSNQVNSVVFSNQTICAPCEWLLISLSSDSHLACLVSSLYLPQFPCRDISLSKIWRTQCCLTWILLHTFSHGLEQDKDLQILRLLLDLQNFSSEVYFFLCLSSISPGSVFLVFFSKPQTLHWFKYWKFNLVHTHLY